MKTRAFLAAALMLAVAAGAQESNTLPKAKKTMLEHVPISCARAGELPLLQVSLASKGELRAYFRRINTSDWCSVEGTNDGPLSRVVLPKFDNGDEIEYFLVLIEGRRVVARSPRIHRAKVTTECGNAWARHILKLSLSCGDDATGIPGSMASGYALTEQLILSTPPYGSPDRPLPAATSRMP